MPAVKHTLAQRCMTYPWASVVYHVEPTLDQCRHAIRVEEAKNGRAESMNANYVPHVRSFTLQGDVTWCDVTCPGLWYMTRHFGPVRDSMDPAAS